MGLFDKLKQAVLKETTMKKEDFSGLSDLQVLEKIDQYANELQKTPNKMVFAKLSAAVDEFDQRVSSLPMSKRGAISQGWACLKGLRDQIGRTIDLPTDMPTIVAGQIPGWVGQIYTELCK